MLKKIILPNILFAIDKIMVYTLGKSISYKRQQMALQSTCEFIDEKLQAVYAFKSRLEVLHYAIKRMHVNGLCLEFGVYKANTINYIAGQLPDTTIYGFDSFEGLPEDWREGFSKGTFGLKHLPKKRKNVAFVVGWFDKTLPDFLANHNAPVSFLHIDCDLYSSAKTVFELLQNRIVSGTIIVFDEYFNFPGWQQCEHKAFTEFIAYSGLSYEYLCYNKNHEQLAVRIK